MITKLAGLESDPDVKYKTREEQVLLLQQVMAATDAEIGEEEMIFGPGGGKIVKTIKLLLKSNFRSCDCHFELHYYIMH